MALRATFNMPDINALTERKKQAFHDAVVYRLNYLGFECYKIARERGSYIDQTSNLRSSTGYIILYDGTLVKSGGFEQIKSSKEGIRTKYGKLDKRYKANKSIIEKKEGDDIGKELAFKIANEYQSGYVLIVVAGMEYALSVESKGYDVLTSAELYAKDEIKDILKKVVSDVAKIK